MLRSPYRQTFTWVRPVFVRTAQQLEPTPEAAKRSWSFSEHCTNHIITAMLDGEVTLDDDDRLLQLLFDHISVHDRTHGYWPNWRQLEDALAAHAEALAPRVFAFWRWRLEVLESFPDGPDREREASGLAWLMLADRLPAAEALPPACRTAVLSRGALPVEMRFWARAKAFMIADAGLTLELLQLVIVAS